jgi:galactokinase
MSTAPDAGTDRIEKTTLLRAPRERVWRALDLLAQENGAGFGALMNESHQSSRNNFDNSSPELDLLVEIAQGIPGVLGARLTGAGFGGCTVNLVRPDAIDVSSGVESEPGVKDHGKMAKMFQRVRPRT